jgi:peptide/nickel transport system substrate-binding protein
MRIGIGVPPEGTRGTGGGIVVRLLTSEPWLTNRPDGRQGERIATRWEWDDARTTLRLTLRKDVYFHDGSRLTPEIAAEVLRETQKNAATEAFSFSSVKEIVASGEDTVDLKLAEVNSFIVPDLSAVVVSKPGKPEIATGPFQVVSQSPQNSRLVAFPRYYRGQPGVGEIEVINYPTQRNAWAALMRGEIDMLHEVSRDAAEFVEAESTVKTYSFPRPYVIPLVFNVRHPVLKNIEVRRAINEALDRAALVRDGLRGRGRPADGPVFPQHWSYSPPPQPYIFDAAKARQRLDAAGLRVKAGKDGTAAPRFSFTCLVFAGDTRFDRLAVIVQKELADVGIDMKLQPMPLKDFVKHLNTGEFDAFIFEMAGRSLSWVNEFWRSKGTLNNSGYVAADDILDKLRGARSEEETRDQVAKLQRLMQEDPPAAFLAWQETARAVSTNFDVAPEERRDILTNLWQWRPVGQRASR